ncbi:inhibitor of vertebrate lysozyme family protein [Pseudomonas sp. ZM23]|uniref:Inhibitor of vertebrate lysozyme family protein n=1 Tax=Pseudomonas triclosanedens TaxID=2961893 RepID=A0ABY7A074_9PSED|nr:inhibitor of vertebrate lysozyme family protein [Pseudomonas triclosanedens]MCP8462466.1 inhibitor of vertebrate lysozyme family protein [Pseudomonas triclosanedens]MCP8468104.1 inhibitor of vertebrate lysozyme family protein [Pseudomonas triclosanedens]MCP8474863.1 inhibitor of vertebrate lysozyme family protein [Pseudomonas triclosanedens]WAI49660.1 inhibitor of vertebrate lysozyme family protein [Pseudomonas triclosanedens]
MSFSRNLLICFLLLTGAGAQALAADADKDAQYRLDELLSSDPQYRQTWQSLIEDESRLPDWVMNLSGTATPMQAVDEQGDKYLVGELCEPHNCADHRLYVAFSWDKEKAYALYVKVPEGLPADKSPSRHASFRWLGDPDEEVKRILDDQLKSDPNWF